MSDSAMSKIDRATKHINELNELFQKKRPFTYIVETNTKTGDRATGAKKNKAVISEAVNIAADVAHNLRAALDHAYWDIVSPFATTSREKRNIQFPFSETRARLEESIKNRLADRVSLGFYKTLVDLQPHGDPGGDKLLYLIHYLDAVDKHRFPIPTGHYTTLSSDDIIAQVPDFPRGFNNCTFGMAYRDLGWKVPIIHYMIAGFDFGKRVADAPHMFEKELNVPVEVVIPVGSQSDLCPMIPTLHQMTDVARETITIIRASQ